MSIDASHLALVARDVGVRYDLRLTRRRTLRQALADTLRRRNGGSDEHRFWALEGVTFSVQRGEVLGVIGRNGSGKSTLLLTLAGILRPDTGLVRTFGRTSTLLTLGAGFEPDLSGRDNLYLSAAFLGVPRRTIDERLEDIVDFSELGRFVDVPVRKYSAGMRARLGFSIAAHIEPDILLLDEILSVGDTAFQQKSKEKLKELMLDAKAIVIVSHSMPFVKDTCSRVLWLEDGRVAAFGDPKEVAAQYLATAETRQGPVRVVS